MKTIKKYTVKQWKKIDWIMQENICKQFDVILTNYNSPLTKKGMVLKICILIFRQLNKKNFDKGIGIIQKGTSMLSEFGNEFGKAFDSGSRKTGSNQNIRKAFWGDDKPSKRTRKDSTSFYGKRISFSSKDKVDFW